MVAPASMSGHYHLSLESKPRARTYKEGDNDWGDGVSKKKNDAHDKSNGHPRLFSKHRYIVS